MFNWIADLTESHEILKRIDEGHRAIAFVTRLTKVARQFKSKIAFVVKPIPGFEGSRGFFLIDANCIQLQLYNAEAVRPGDDVRPSHLRIDTVITLAHELGHAAAAFRSTAEERKAVGDRRVRFHKSRRDVSYQDLLDIVVEEADAWTEGRVFLEEAGFTEWGRFYKNAHRALGTYLSYIERAAPKSGSSGA